jgi:hypothetical protein
MLQRLPIAVFPTPASPMIVALFCYEEQVQTHNTIKCKLQTSLTLKDEDEKIRCAIAWQLTFLRRDRTWMVCRISSSLPMTGSAVACSRHQVQLNLAQCFEPKLLRGD